LRGIAKVFNPDSPAASNWADALRKAADDLDTKDAQIAALRASCEEFLPILDRQLASINPGGAAESSVAFQTASARVERMRAAVARSNGAPSVERVPVAEEPTDGQIKDFWCQNPGSWDETLIKAVRHFMRGAKS
jgi:hypothetical protein